MRFYEYRFYQQPVSIKSKIYSLHLLNLNKTRKFFTINKHIVVLC